MGLVYVGNLHRLAHLERTLVALLLPHNELEEGGLAGSVGTDYPHDAVGRQHKVEVVEEQLVAVGLGHTVSLDHLVAQTGTVGDKDFELLFALLLVLVQQFVVGVQTILTLRLAGLGSHAHPLQLALEGLAAFAGLLLLHLHAFGLLLEPRGIVALPGDTLAAVEFENPAGHMVEEVTVVRDGDNRTGILVQVLFEPVDRLGVEVVGRLVEQQDVGLLQQQAAEGHPAAFTPREVFHKLVFGRTAQSIHRLLQLVVDIPGIRGVDMVLQFGLASHEGIHLVGILEHFGVAKRLVHLFILGQQVEDRLHALLHHLLHRLFGVELGLLLEVTHRVARREYHFALVRLLHPGDDFQQGRFSRAVKTDNTDLGPVEKREINVFQYLFVGREHFAHAHHREYNFLVVGHIKADKKILK